MQVDPLEPRRLFAFATFDDAFGAGGFATIDAAALDVDARVTPLDDGRLIVAQRSGVFFRRGDGNADPKRGRAGAVALTGRVVDVAVEAATGRFAALRDLGKVDGARAFAVDRYDARGRLDATRTVVSSANGTPVALAFDPVGGGVVVATDRTLADGPGTVARRAVLWRLDADALAIDATFGEGGRATIDFAAGVDARLGERATLDRFLLDDTGRPHVVATTVTFYSNGTGKLQTHVHRPPALAEEATWAAVLVRNDPIVPETVAGAHVDANVAFGAVPLPGGGVQWMRGRSGVRASNSGTLQEWTIVNRQAVGTYTRYSDTREIYSFARSATPATLRAAGLAVAPGGDVFVAVNGESGASIATFRRLNVKDTWAMRTAPADDALVPFAPTSIAVDRGGRLVGAGVVADFAGRRRLALFALDGSTFADAVSADVRAGDATIGVDGAVRVRGTARGDLIVVRPDGADLVVEINDDVRRFPLADVRAVCVAAGRGDDFVEIAPSLPGVRVYGEAGDDTIIGGGGDDTLSGGSGDDRIDGRAGDDRLLGDAGADALVGGAGDDLLRGGDGNDELRGDAGNDALYGEADKDVLLGGDGADWLAGNSGNDRLYASGLVDSVGVDDGAADTLFGDAGLDYIRADAGDRDLFTLDAYDTLAYA